MSDLQTWLDEQNHEYERLHTAKEDAFWAAYMGLADDAEAARAALVERENALKRFLTDPARLRATRRRIEEVEARSAPAGAPPLTDEQRLALRGWEATFAANVIESAEARALGEELVEDEGRLARARATMRLGYEHPAEGFREESSVKLGVLMHTAEDERVRRAAWDGLRSIETHVLQHGFLDLVRKRNRYGRLLGGEDFYDATVRRVEGMSKGEVFLLLDELEERTRERARRSIEELRATRGSERVRPWNLRYLVAGDVIREEDPHFPFQKALERWGRSFAALGIRYRGASLVLDLVDRKGKYENGFMHGPVPAWRERGSFRPARIQFTANAIPGMVGSGKRATETLFHEGGHAAHFANNDMPAPCFAQEFAPSSVAFAETQSMFLDSLLSDADWQSRYAARVDGTPIPFALIERGLRCEQPFAAIMVRAMLAVCYGEKAIYELPEERLTPAGVQEALREVERRMLFLDEGAPRPVLAVPHLLAGESSAYYHGYVLAEMAVHHTRRFFLERDGHLVDNRRIGPDLAQNYWKEGNLHRFGAFVERLTGRPLSAEAMAAHVARDAEAAVADARAAVETLAEVPPFEGEVRLDARIRVAHGNETVAEDDGRDFASLAAGFERWIAEFPAADRGNGAKRSPA